MSTKISSKLNVRAFNFEFFVVVKITLATF